MTKAKTRMFSVSVTIGEKTFAPGDSVKIGAAKDALTTKDADAIDKVHGAYSGDAKPAAVEDPRAKALEDELAGANKKLAEQTERADTAEAKLAEQTDRADAADLKLNELLEANPELVDEDNG